MTSLMASLQPSAGWLRNGGGGVVAITSTITVMGQTSIRGCYRDGHATAHHHHHAITVMVVVWAILLTLYLEGLTPYPLWTYPRNSTSGGHRHEDPRDGTLNDGMAWCGVVCITTTITAMACTWMVGCYGDGYTITTTPLPPPSRGRPLWLYPYGLTQLITANRAAPR